MRRLTSFLTTLTLLQNEISSMIKPDNYSSELYLYDCIIFPSKTRPVSHSHWNAKICTNDSRTRVAASESEF